ncbi:hypothetical protein H7F33_05485 [Pedobacter sp. PAMC26386]|nr:hypothetical protein H7F33_05485 [Pedobacter sp. PAMC26386]
MKSNKYKIDNTDLYTTCRFMVETGWVMFLTWASRKEPFSNDWAEQNGKEYDLAAAPKFNDRVFKLKGVIEAISLADFWAKYDALFALMNKPGTLNLNVVELGKTFKVFYRDMTVLSIPTSFSGNQIIVQIEIQLQEVQQA